MSAVLIAIALVIAVIAIAYYLPRSFSPAHQLLFWAGRTFSCQLLPCHDLVLGNLIWDIAYLPF